jgi:hypothetical protein
MIIAAFLKQSQESIWPIYLKPMLIATRKVVAVNIYERFFIPLQEAHNHYRFNHYSAVDLGIRSKV